MVQLSRAQNLSVVGASFEVKWNLRSVSLDFECLMMTMLVMSLDDLARSNVVRHQVNLTM